MKKGSFLAHPRLGYNGWHPFPKGFLLVIMVGIPLLRTCSWEMSRFKLLWWHITIILLKKTKIEAIYEHYYWMLFLDSKNWPALSSIWQGYFLIHHLLFIAAAMQMLCSKAWHLLGHSLLIFFKDFIRKHACFPSINILFGILNFFLPLDRKFSYTNFNICPCF